MGCVFSAVMLAVLGANAEVGGPATNDGLSLEFPGLGTELALPLDLESPAPLAREVDEDAVQKMTVAMAEAPAAPFGAADTWRFSVQGAFGIAPGDTENMFLQGGVGFSYFMVERLSLELEFNAFVAIQENDNGYGGNFNLLFRWHFYENGPWTLFIDGGAGLLLTVNDVPDDGSSFNFTPQFGAGFSVDLNSDTRLLAGVRWHHISNANTYDENPGRDSFEVHAGLSFPF